MNEETQSGRDEDELQEILENNPNPKKSKCIFCDNQSSMYIDPEEAGVKGNKPVPVCQECWPEDDWCVTCLIGDYCPDHMTWEEFLLGQSVHQVFDDDDSYDDDPYGEDS